MSMLAGPRQKQRISVDPQNMKWKKSNNIGKSLMTKMNWSEGKGLGKHEHGMAENLKLKANFSGKGLGCDSATYKAKDPWISHHDDFDNLLASLNSKTTKNQTSTASQSANGEDDSIQGRSRKSKTRVHYKFTKGKDLSLATDRQKAAIFGVVNSVDTVQKTADEQIDHNVSKLMTVSSISTTDYYKEKMAKIMNRRSNQSDQVVEKKSKKRKRLDS